MSGGGLGNVLGGWRNVRVRMSGGNVLIPPGKCGFIVRNISECVTLMALRTDSMALEMEIDLTRHSRKMAMVKVTDEIEVIIFLCRCINDRSCFKKLIYSYVCHETGVDLIIVFVNQSFDHLGRF